MWTNPCKMLTLLLKMKKSIHTRTTILYKQVSFGLVIVLNTNEHLIWCLQLYEKGRIPP